MICALKRPNRLSGATPEWPEGKNMEYRIHQTRVIAVNADTESEAWDKFRENIAAFRASFELTEELTYEEEESVINEDGD